MITLLAAELKTKLCYSLMFIVKIRNTNKAEIHLISNHLSGVEILLINMVKSDENI